MSRSFAKVFLVTLSRGSMSLAHLWCATSFSISAIAFSETFPFFRAAFLISLIVFIVSFSRFPTLHGLSGVD